MQWTAQGVQWTGQSVKWSVQSVKWIGQSVQWTVSAADADAATLSFAMPDFVSAGDPWVIDRQPDWLVTPVTWPAGGVL